MDSSEQASASSSHSSTTTDLPIITSLKPNEYIKGLNEEHITRLTKDAFKHFVDYTKAELQLTVDDCQLLETMNKATTEKYVQMNQMSQRLMKEMSKLQNTYADFSDFIQQIEDIHEQSIQMEKTAKALDEYSKYLENKLLTAINKQGLE
ncbi:biogenesis of lysosome-related organelles complex-1 subunit 2-domain-containing protein [Cokeromyces recurvatus]|uniref:biogenesis of lysosome-related organelles complex-1 subunit 2-domain-containing protein n=1 Tax=Cokeromyces recurvatus TaxID=90255 RepID=UPI00221F08F1|nr:biogenesis of lysosome-related organelles complex-1 subunit 2-domain-containing protein [Cokeromyces recurvatus]KAI7902909.1 biogenesis of lysosome-related organelles complex-1 subunit 2-domain-containing protein [Cokeromyces recurvatus]